MEKYAIAFVWKKNSHKHIPRATKILSVKVIRKQNTFLKQKLKCYLEFSVEFYPIVTPIVGVRQ
jgi:hypothetical protein